MNSSNNSLSSPEDRCFYPVYRRPIIHDEYVISDYLFLVLAVIINLLTCPLVVLLNALVITAITTKRRLQTTQNILLACLAVTDLVVGIGAQPAFITQKIILLVYDGSSSLSCKLDNVIQLAILCLCLLSLLHLVVISVERLVAMKNPFRCEEIVTKFRLIVAVVCSWFLIAMIFVARMLRFKAFSPFIITHVGFPVIVFCHINVYFICRRHEIQIQSEQVSQEATEKFLKEKKAWKQPLLL